MEQDIKHSSPDAPFAPQTVYISSCRGTQQVYFILSMITYLLNIINPNHSFVVRLKDLLATYPSIDIRAMGFPANWENEDIWK